MAKGKKYFSETKFYPILFMIILTIFFIGILATFHHLTAERITRYQEEKLKREILNLFSIEIVDVNTDFERYISKESEAGLDYYVAYRDSLLGYCFPIAGQGLWGTIEALLALTPNLEHIINIAILEQNETPGLGGRITEDWFLSQFSEKPIYEEGEIISYNLIPEGEPRRAQQVNQITGATSSSRAVVRILHENAKQILRTMGVDDE